MIVGDPQVIGTPHFLFSLIIEGTTEKVNKLYGPVLQHNVSQAPKAPFLQ
jgi:hypothetical protein